MDKLLGWLSSKAVPPVTAAWMASFAPAATAGSAGHRPGQALEPISMASLHASALRRATS